MNSSVIPTVLGVTLLVSGLATACGKEDSSAEATATPLTPVKVATLEKETLVNSSDFLGNLQASQRVEVKPEIQGRIKAIKVKEGDRIQQGKSILSLEPDQTVPQLQGAQAGISEAKAAYNTAQQQLQVAQAQLATAQSDYQLANTNNQRAKFLVSQGAIGQYQADEAANNLATAKNKVTTAQKQVTAAQAQIKQAEAAIQQAQAQADVASVSVNFKEVAAPIAGSIGDIPVKVGDYITTGQTITTITKNDSLDLNIWIPSNRSAQLRPGLPVQLFDPTTQKQSATGKINFISPRVDPTQQSILVKARFPNSGRLRDGQYVQAKVVWDKKAGFLVPTTAISRIGGTSFVFVVEEQTTQDGKTQQIVRQRQVKLGDVQEQSYQVLEGLKSGEKIATSNILKLKDNAPVQPES
ncbi:efflux RND transporter periplasmic adaptor subunit [Fischerella sp. PCC 9605]|uniref:efflux RND transporter periplasmic adaptor subunit n=1 Tax=Fischerella sp. PCC 9605 TaxID=1173024 RepID=UPI001E4BF027|nr:efflux RND transporter periplasmic adaptor subunit [Fischerella sp. PCC 9605]